MVDWSICKVGEDAVAAESGCLGVLSVHISIISIIIPHDCTLESITLLLPLLHMIVHISSSITKKIVTVLHISPGLWAHGAPIGAILRFFQSHGASQKKTW